MKTFFVTATGTAIGKTLITTALCFQLRQKGYKVRGIKPVISGWVEGDNDSDTALILRSLSLPVTEETISRTSPWRLAAPLSPDMAADMEGIRLSVDEIAAFCKDGACDVLVIEGAGGIMTPLSPHATMLDLMVKLSAQVVLVTGTYLGSLSHTLTAWEVLTLRGLVVPTVVVSESENSTVSLVQTLASLRQFIPQGVMGVERLEGQGALWEKVPEIGC